MAGKTVERSRSSRSSVSIALMRGINVGGKNTLPMKSLVSMFEEAGCTGVQTYIQSGNVVFVAAPGLARRVPAIIQKTIAEELGFQVPVITRTAAELSQVAGANPFVEAGAEAHTLHVAFLADRPPAARAAALDPNRSPPDAFAVRGREIYLQCPNGLARTRLTNAYFDSTLATTCTVRNWKTTLKLLAMAEG